MRLKLRAPRSSGKPLGRAGDPTFQIRAGDMLASVNSFELDRRGAMHAAKFKEHGDGRPHLAAMVPVAKPRNAQRGGRV